MTDARLAVAVSPREAALELARSGAPLAGTDLAAILEIKKSRYHVLAKTGAFDHLKIRPAVGPRCYSGTLITKWLQGEPVYEPSFGRTRHRG